MSKLSKPDTSGEVPEVVPGQAASAEPSVADLMVLVAQLQAQVAAQAPKVEKPVDFTAQVEAAQAKGFKASVVPGFQKGAQPALRVDH